MKKIGSNAFWKASGSLAGSLVLLVILIAVNVILNNVRLRADLTGEKLYTLSDGTRNILKKLDKNVTLKLFFNSSAPEVPAFLKNYARQVEDLLKEYRMAAGRKLTIEKYDPQPDSDAEEWAQRYQLSGHQIDMLGLIIYIGLVAVAGKNEAVLPVLDPRTEELLEYNITRLIYRVSHPEKPVVGVMSSLPVLGTATPSYPLPGQPRPQSMPPWLAFRDLREDYTVREISLDTDRIDEDIHALVVVHPKNLPDRTLFAIDQFILRGGRLLLFLDPLCITEIASSSQEPFARPEVSSDMKRLLSTWGIGYETDRVLVDPGAVSRIRGADNQIEESPVWLSLDANNISRKDILTAQLEFLMMPFSGAFFDQATSPQDPSDNMTVTPLITSSDGAGMVNSMAAQFGSAAVWRDFKEEAMPLNIAIRISGKFRTAFPDGKPSVADGGDVGPRSTPVHGEPVQGEPAATEKKEEKTETMPGITEGESSAILIADVDMIYDRFCVQELNFFGAKAYQPLNDNINFLANAVEQIAGSSDLVGIRCRGKFSRPFDRVLALEHKARLQWQEKENDLITKLNQTQQQLSELQTRKDSSQRFILSERQKEAIAKFRQEEIRIKKELKDVRKNLRRDIEQLGVKVKIANIALMPLLVSAVGIFFGIYRRRKTQV